MQPNNSAHYTSFVMLTYMSTLVWWPSIGTSYTLFVWLGRCWIILVVLHPRESSQTTPPWVTITSKRNTWQSTPYPRGCEEAHCDTNIAACRNCKGHKERSIDVSPKTVERNGGHYCRHRTKDDKSMVRFDGKLGARNAVGGHSLLVRGRCGYLRKFKLSASSESVSSEWSIIVNFLEYTSSDTSHCI